MTFSKIITHFSSFLLLINTILYFKSFAFFKTTQAEIDDFMDEDTPKIALFHQLFPAYAQQFLSGYFSYENNKSRLVREDLLPFFNYLEYGFEVDLYPLEWLSSHEVLLKFATGNYPYGGMDRFLMTLKAFELRPDDVDTIRTLMSLYENTEMDDKFKTMKEKYDSLK